MNVITDGSITQIKLNRQEAFSLLGTLDRYIDECCSIEVRSCPEKLDMWELYFQLASALASPRKYRMAPK